MAERGDSARNHMPPGLLAIDIQGDGGWLFLGQIGASIGFTAYSYHHCNRCFLFSNSAMLMTAIVGDYLCFKSQRSGKLDA
jgi:hypothetical protein